MYVSLPIFHFKYIVNLETDNKETSELIRHAVGEYQRIMKSYLEVSLEMIMQNRNITTEY